ncbi:MAG: HIT family protein [Flavobacteriaceae bacterium]|nr:HIT family protein [Flavobacteriaceae bacterium]
MSSIFTKIVNGDIPAYKVAETDEFLAFLDINPNAKGHTLCILKEEIDKWYDIDNQRFTDLMAFSKRVALAIEETIACKRVGLSIIGLEVPHVHVHLIPLREMDNARFISKISLSESEFKATAQAIIQAFNNQNV